MMIAPSPRFRRRFRLLVSALALLGLLTATAPAQYLFTNIVDSTGPLIGLGVKPALNDAGVVAFRTGFSAIGPVKGVYIGDGTSITPIVEFSDVFGGFFDPAINDAGTVAFFYNTGGTPAQSRIYSGNGGPLTTIADTAGPFNTLGGSVAINASGTVFSGSFDSGGGGTFIGNGGTPTLIPNVGGFSFSINDSGVVAFNTALGIYTSNGGPRTTIVEDSQEFNEFSAPAINEAGTVAFAAGVLDVGGSAIFTGSGGPLTLIADISGPFASFGLNSGNPPAINNVGTVAFTAILDAGGFGLYTNTAGAIGEVIGSGDALFNSTVADFSISTHSLNDSGQLAFYYRLENGLTGIALASPVPEPCSGLLLAGALSVLAGFGRHRESGVI